VSPVIAGQSCARRFVVYWQAKRGTPGDAAAARHRPDRDSAPAAGILQIVEVIGEAVASATGSPARRSARPMGATRPAFVDEIIPAERVAIAHRHYSVVCEPPGRSSCAKIHDHEGDRSNRGEPLILPLSEDGSRVDKLLIAARLPSRRSGPIGGIDRVPLIEAYRGQIEFLSLSDEPDAIPVRTLRFERFRKNARLRGASTATRCRSRKAAIR